MSQVFVVCILRIFMVETVEEQCSRPSSFQAERQAVDFLRQVSGRVRLRAVRPDGRSREVMLNLTTTLQEVVAP